MSTQDGFLASEYRARLKRAQMLMADSDLDALFLTTEAEIRYFTGFLTRFWESPTRVWMLIVPAVGDPIAMIPQIGVHLMAQSWITDIRSWNAPDYSDDGHALAADTLRSVTRSGARIGVPCGIESHLHLPLDTWDALRAALPTHQFVSDDGTMAKLRAVKSPAEIAKIRQSCQIANRAFDRVAEIAGVGVPLSSVFRDFQRLCLEEGADWVSYLAGGAGQGGYGDVISPAGPTPLQNGDVLMLDTGLVRDGYFCDFDRNFAIGSAHDDTHAAYERLLLACDAGFAAAKPGASASGLFDVMHEVLCTGGWSSAGGRLGHGLGMQLTEGLSLIAQDQTVLLPGMVLTLEPGIVTPSGAILVHEENIVITETGAEYLSQPAPRQLPIIT